MPPLPTATHLARLRTKAVAYLLPDTCVILTRVLVDDGEGGYTPGAPTSQGPYACLFQMTGAGERRSDGQDVQEAGPTVVLPALAPVDLNDTITVTVTETSETIGLSVRGFTKSSSEVLRLALCALVTPQDLT